MLELGLAAVVVLAPLPFGSIGPASRLGLELGALVLGLIWTVRALSRPTPLPGLGVRAGLAGLLVLAALQAVPLGQSVVGLLSPRSLEIRSASVPPADALAAETRLLQRDPGSLDGPPTLSIDPSGTASALRTGAALASLLLVATTVAATVGAARLCLALLVSAAFQGLYGLLVLPSGYDRIWHLPKRYYLDAATGTFVNKNHFACFLAMALAAGMGLILHNRRAVRRSGPRRTRLVQTFSAEGSRNLMLGLLLLTGLAGLMASFSRAGIALGVLALAATLILAGQLRGWRLQLGVMLLILLAAVVPLWQIGADRLLERYADSAGDLTVPGGRGRVWIDTLSLARAFPLAGSGFGTFSPGYELVRSPEVRLHYTHAHNDLLQALSEGGLVGFVLLGFLLGPLVLTAGRALAGRKGALGVGLAAGLAAMLLHGLLDFNFHLPANAATASILAGALLGLPWKSPS